ncbi:hypothetical protein BCR42DRAFT_490690 [Absidia repens]|uniref:Uncharacterized protein n=1 Tax=Absidia repens TaxID=90262 RepID=A0A1X2IKG3_9FUNG|nr:hypothetical protein BCR42DRAFT_490690 [Absidia repens]
MLFSTPLFLLLVPVVLSAPIQQWSVTTNLNNPNNQQDFLKDDHQVTSSTLNLVIHDDIQTYYENIVDEIISTRSEDVLMKLAHSMSNDESLESLLQPQAITLLDHPVQGTCLARMPGMIAQQLHRLHTKVLDAIEPAVDSLLKTYPLTITELDDGQPQPQQMQQNLVLLNNAMDQHVMQVLKQAHLEHKVALQLAVCENQLDATPPRRSLWLLLKNIWLNAAKTAKSSSNEKEQQDASPYNHDHDSLFVSSPSLLSSLLDTFADNLHLEFEGRLVDLYATLRSDVFDEEAVI